MRAVEVKCTFVVCVSACMVKEREQSHTQDRRNMHLKHMSSII